MLYTAFIFGLISSFHCVGMCGAISIMLPTDSHNPLKKALQLSVYHIGKLLSYASIGLLFGALGKGLFLAGFQQRLSIVLGTCMLMVILIPERVLMRYNFSKPIFKVVSNVKSTLGAQFKKKTYKSLFVIGLLNGFLPCAMVYVAVFGALAMQNLLNGVLYMTFFGLGTIPLLITVAYMQDLISNTFRSTIQKIIPYAAVCLALLFIVRGLGLGIPYVSPSNTHLHVTEKPACVTP